MDSNENRRVDFNGTSPMIKFLLSSGPVAWLLLGFGVIAWGLKLEARYDSVAERAMNLQTQVTAIDARLSKSIDNRQDLQREFLLVKERQLTVIRRLDKLEKQP